MCAYLQVHKLPLGAAQIKKCVAGLECFFKWDFFLHNKGVQIYIYFVKFKIKSWTLEQRLASFANFFVRRHKK